MKGEKGREREIDEERSYYLGMSRIPKVGSLL